MEGWSNKSKTTIAQVCSLGTKGLVGGHEAMLALEKYNGNKNKFEENFVARRIDVESHSWSLETGAPL
jgi:hypothetical protein